MRLSVNGEAAEHAGTIADLLTDWFGDPRPQGVAVAVNGEVVRRDDWSRRPLVDGDRVEVVTAVQGG